MSTTGSVSMIGNDLFSPVDCLASTLRPFFVKQIVFAVLPVFCVVCLALFWGGKKWLSMHHRRKHGIAHVHHSEVPAIMEKRHQQRKKAFQSHVRAGLAAARARMQEEENVKADGTATRSKSGGFAVAALSKVGRIHADEVVHLTRVVRSQQHGGSSNHHKHMGRNGMTQDQQATATLHAREFMEFCHDNHVDLHDVWRKYDKRGDGDITTAQFETIIRSFGFEWSPEDFIGVLTLFDGANSDGLIDLATLVQFSRNYWEKFVLGCTTIGILLYPTLVTSFFKLVACVGGLADGDHPSDSFAMDDLTVRCYHGEHLAFVLGLGIPMGLCYVLGLPFFMVGLLHHAMRHVDTQHHDSVRYRYGILMAGFADDKYAWELVVVSRKGVMAAIATFGATLGPDAQLFFSIFLVGGFICLQVGHRPYHDPMLNRMELWCLLIVFISLYVGILFLLEKLPQEMKTPVSISLVVLHTLFMLYCVAHLIHDGNTCRKTSKTAPAVALGQLAAAQRDKAKSGQKFRRKSAVRPKAMAKMAIRMAAANARSTTRLEAQARMKAVLDEAGPSSGGSASELAEARAKIEAGAAECERAGAFDATGLLLLEVAAKEIERIDKIIASKQTLTASRKFKPKVAAALAIPNKPAEGVTDVLESLLAVTDVNAFEWSVSSLRNNPPKPAERWKSVRMELKDPPTVAALFEGIDAFNPLRLGEDLAHGVEARIITVNPQKLAQQNTACGDLLVWLAEMLQIWVEREEDRIRLEEDCAQKERACKEGQDEETKTTATPPFFPGEEKRTVESLSSQVKDWSFATGGEALAEVPVESEAQSSSPDDALAEASLEEKPQQEKPQEKPPPPPLPIDSDRGTANTYQDGGSNFSSFLPPLAKGAGSQSAGGINL